MTAELELERIKKDNEDDIFSLAEEREFTYIRNIFDRQMILTVQEGDAIHQLSINPSTLLPFLTDEYWQRSVEYLIIDHVFSTLEYDDRRSIRFRGDSTDFFSRLRDEFQVYGLLKRIDLPVQQKRGRGISILDFQPEVKFVFTDKMQRYRYWLRYKDAMPESIEFEKIA